MQMCSGLPFCADRLPVFLISVVPSTSGSGSLLLTRQAKELCFIWNTAKYAIQLSVLPCSSNNCNMLWRNNTGPDCKDFLIFSSSKQNNCRPHFVRWPTAIYLCVTMYLNIRYSVLVSSCYKFILLSNVVIRIEVYLLFNRKICPWSVTAAHWIALPAAANQDTTSTYTAD